ncbi:TetR/AcrR family transcriptional regulator [Microbacterium sp. P05]|uniref:TetR/AcrR family transcriptional regulator n=1 Tax=Microbacterium sp. P05 TaxID=3366948 RepID=UPI003745F67B
MATEQRGGRPRASSRETLAEAASELFLEKGFDETSVADITTRAGVSRSSFFNYFSTKSDVLWAGFDERIDALPSALAAGGDDLDVAIRSAVATLVHDLRPDTLALALAQADTMRLADELERDSSVRRSRIAGAVLDHLRGRGVDDLRADVVAAAYGGAVLAALARWADAGAGRTPLESLLAQALEAVPPVRPSRSIHLS